MSCPGQSPGSSEAGQGPADAGGGESGQGRTAFASHSIPAETLQGFAQILHRFPLFIQDNNTAQSETPASGGRVEEQV